MVREEIEVELSCKTLQVSRSGYYSWKKRPESDRKKENAVLIAEIKEIHDESRKTYGAPRICQKLRLVGKKIGKNRVSRLMKIAGVSGLMKRKFKVKTTDSNHENPIAPQVFKTEDVATHPVAPNRIWTSDISYIPTEEGFLYLGTFLDLFTRKVVGFAIDDHMRVDLLIRALEMAVGRQGVDLDGLIAHSDRGSQYASEEYRGKLQNMGCVLSMSRKGNCYDNAAAESFFATLKKELIYRRKFKTKAEAKNAIF